MSLQLIEPRGLELRIVVAVQVVEPDHLLAALEEPLRRVIADEARRAGDQNLHRFTGVRRWRRAGTGSARRTARGAGGRDGEWRAAPCRGTGGAARQPRWHRSCGYADG